MGRIAEDAEEYSFALHDVHAHEPGVVLADVIALSHTDGALRFRGSAGAAHQEIVYVQTAAQYLEIVIVTRDEGERRMSGERAAE